MKFDIIPEKLPRHIAFIMDGNGRWATKRLLPRSAGHRQGVETLKKTVSACFDLGIEYVSVYAFSTENHARPEDEKIELFRLIKEYFKNSLDYFIKNEVCVRFMGDISCFSDDIKEIINATIHKSAHFTKYNLNIGLNYGSRAEILRAVNIAIEQGKKINEAEFSQLLYTAGMPDPDLIVRTSGECRLSNFMMYQASYSELIFTKTLWPSFGKKQLYDVLTEYQNRSRRFGKLNTSKKT